jgi:hypothetical protein
VLLGRRRGGDIYVSGVYRDGEMTETDEDEDAKDVVPVSELQELADEFRERSEEKLDLGMIQAADEIKQCAKDIEELIEE